ncbi:hypothetical protein D3C78_1220320 [compost metagenome]
MQHHRPHSHTVLQAIAHFDFAHRSGELLDKGFINALLDQEAGWGDAHLTGVAELGQRQLFGGRIQIGIVKNQYRCMTAQLHGGFFHMLTGQRRQMLAHAG